MITTIPEFKAALVAKSVPAGIQLRKDTIGTVVSANDSMLRFIISTQTVDRDSDRVMQSGWQLENYRRNPVVLWGHKSDQPPIGRCVEIDVIEGQLRATVEFVPPEICGIGEFAQGIRQLCERGFLFGTSVGFKPLAWDVTDDPDRGADSLSPGVDFTSVELLEFSIVSVPANPDALILPPVPVIVPTAAPKSLNRNAFLKRARLCRVHELES